MIRFFYVLLLGLVISPSLLLAQDGLTQTFVSEDERLTLRYPAGWVVEEEISSISIASIPVLLDPTSEGVMPTVPSGEAAMVIVLSDDDVSGVIFVGDTPLEVLNSLVELFNESGQDGGFSPPQEFFVGDYEAARTTGSLTGNDALMVVMHMNDGVFSIFIAITAPDELDKFEPKFQAIIESINYAPPPPPPTIDLADLETITVDNAENVELLWQSEGHIGTVTSVSISPDSSLVASSGSDGTIVLWDASTGEQQSILRGHTDIVEQVLFSPDGDTLVSISDDRTVRLWDVASGENTLTVEKDEPLFYMAVSPGGRWVAFISYTQDPDTFVTESSTVWLLDVQTGEDRAVVTLDPNLFANSVAFDPESNILMYSASNDQDSDGRQINVWLWDIERNRETGSDVREGNPVDVFFTPTGRPYAVMNDIRDPNDLLVWDVSENYIQNRLSGIGDLTYHVVLNPEGTIMGSASYDGNVSLWNLENGNPLIALRHEGGAYGVAFSDDGKLVATSDDFGMVYLWGINS